MCVRVHIHICVRTRKCVHDNTPHTIGERQCCHVQTLQHTAATHCNNTMPKHTATPRCHVQTRARQYTPKPDPANLHVKGVCVRERETSDGLKQCNVIPLLQHATRTHYRNTLLQHTAATQCPNTLQHHADSTCVAVCCSVLQCVAVCCSVMQRVAVCCSVAKQACRPSLAVCCSVLQCVAVCCSVRQCVAACAQTTDESVTRFRLAASK